jgi:hypothetical protein
VFDGYFFDVFVGFQFDHLGLQVFNLCFDGARDVLTVEVSTYHNVQTLNAFKKVLTHG